MAWSGLKPLVQWMWQGSRTSLENPQTPLSYPAEWLLDIFNGGRTDSGIRVSELTALQVPHVIACVGRISGAIAGQPMRIFERVETGDKIVRHSKRLAVDHPLFDVLRYRPNDEMTHATFMRTYMCHALLWGNAYAEIQRDKGGRPVALWPRNPVRTRPRRLLKPLPEEPDNRFPMVYITTEGMEQMDQNYAEGVMGEERIIRKEDMLHVPGLSLDGRLGQDTVWLSRQIIGLALSSEKYAAKFFGNGATPSGVLETSGTLKKESRDALRNMWMESQGGENIHRPALLEGGVKFTPISAKPSEAQMIEARQQVREEIYEIFGVSIPGKETRANAEQKALELVNYTLKPWVASLEEEFKVKLFPPMQFGRNARRTFIVLIDMRNLELPDATAKKNYYSAARQWTWETPNGILEMEDENPISGPLGESYLVPVNMTAVDADGKVILQGTNSANKPSGPAAPAGQGVDQPAKQQNSKTRNLQLASREALWPAFRDAFGRISARRDRNQRDFDRIFRPVLECLCAMNGDSSETIDVQLRGLSVISADWFKPENIEAGARGVWNGEISLREQYAARLYLARHGETDNDAAGKSDDGNSDEPLNAEGRGQAQSLAGYVAANLAIPLQVYCGSPVRHQQTASRIADAKMLSGLDPQGKDESDKDFSARVIQTLDELRSLSDGASCLAVTSHRAIKIYAKHAGGSESHVPFCSLWDTGADGKSMIQIFRPGA